MASGRMSKSLNVSKASQRRHSDHHPSAPNRQKRSFIMIKPGSVSALVVEKSGRPSLQPHDLFLRFVRALAEHQARKDHRAEIESRRRSFEIKENRNVGRDDV